MSAIYRGLEGSLEKELLKKKSATSKLKITRELVLKFAPEYGAVLVARVLGLSRQRVHYILKHSKTIKIRKIRKMNDEDMVLRKIEEIVKELPVYGYRRVTAVLRARYGVPFNRKKVYRIMKQKDY